MGRILGLSERPSLCDTHRLVISSCEGGVKEDCSAHSIPRVPCSASPSMSVNVSLFLQKAQDHFLWGQMTRVLVGVVPSVRGC